MKEIDKKDLPINVAYQYLRSKGVVHTQQDVADKMNVSKENISRAFNGNEKYLTSNFLDRFNKSFNMIFNEEWLKTGEGEMLKKNEVNIEAVPTMISGVGEYYTKNNNGIKFYKLENGKYRMTVKKVPFCAYGRFANDSDTLEPDKEDWEEESFEFDEIVHGKYLAFEVKGESMDDGTRNSFEEGDIVLVRELGRQHWKDKFRFNDHPYWVIVFDSSVLIKQMVAQNMETG